MHKDFLIRLQIKNLKGHWNVRALKGVSLHLNQPLLEYFSKVLM